MRADSTGFDNVVRIGQSSKQSYDSSRSQAAYMSIELPKPDANYPEQVDVSQQVDSEIDTELQKTDKFAKVDATIAKQSSPICLTNLMMDRPCLLIPLGFLVLLALCYLSLYYETWNFSKGSEREFLVTGHKTLTNWDMQVGAQEYIASKRDSGK